MYVVGVAVMYVVGVAVMYSRIALDNVEFAASAQMKQHFLK
jgi:biotin transporter BioY